jgi:HTH-type transcriptional regulator / antitoxin HigA
MRRKAKIDIHPIRTEADYIGLNEIGSYFKHEPKRGTLDADRFDALAQIEAYEAKH